MIIFDGLKKDYLMGEVNRIIETMYLSVVLTPVMFHSFSSLTVIVDYVS